MGPMPTPPLAGLNDAPRPMQAPATPSIIRREHAALRAVLRGMARMVREARHHRRVPDFGALRAMLFYISEFPERRHHVKESAMLFPRLRAVAPEAGALLDRLHQEHGQGERRLRDLEHLLTAWELLGESRRAAFELALERHTSFYLAHMQAEETDVLPLAERCFGPADWIVLDRAFGSHGDALVDPLPDAEFEALFRRLRQIMPVDEDARA